MWQVEKENKARATKRKVKKARCCIVSAGQGYKLQSAAAKAIERFETIFENSKYLKNEPTFSSNKNNFTPGKFPAFIFAPSAPPLPFHKRATASLQTAKCDKSVSLLAAGIPARDDMMHFVLYFAQSITYARSLKLIVLLVLHVLNLLLQIIRIAFRVADFVGQSVDKVL